MSMIKIKDVPVANDKYTKDFVRYLQENFNGGDYFNDLFPYFSSSIYNYHYIDYLSWLLHCRGWNIIEHRGEDPSIIIYKNNGIYPGDVYFEKSTFLDYCINHNLNLYFNYIKKLKISENHLMLKIFKNYEPIDYEELVYPYPTGYPVLDFKDLEKHLNVLMKKFKLQKEYLINTYNPFPDTNKISAQDYKKLSDEINKEYISVLRDTPFYYL